LLMMMPCATLMTRCRCARSRRCRCCPPSKRTQDRFGRCRRVRSAEGACVSAHNTGMRMRTTAPGAWCAVSASAVNGAAARPRRCFTCRRSNFNLAPSGRSLPPQQHRRRRCHARHRQRQVRSCQRRSQCEQAIAPPDAGRLAGETLRVPPMHVTASLQTVLVYEIAFMC
jgi:hypothetical protein